MGFSDQRIDSCVGAVQAATGFQMEGRVVGIRARLYKLRLDLFPHKSARLARVGELTTLPDGQHRYRHF